MFSGRKGARERELEVQVKATLPQNCAKRKLFQTTPSKLYIRELHVKNQVTAILLSLEKEFEQCQRGLEELGCPNQVKNEQIKKN